MSNIVIVEFPVDTEKDAQKFAKELLLNDLAEVVRYFKDIPLIYTEDGKKVEQFTAVLVSARVDAKKVDDLYKFVKERHAWETFCFDVIETRATVYV